MSTVCETQSIPMEPPCTIIHVSSEWKDILETLFAHKMIHAYQIPTKNNDDACCIQVVWIKDLLNCPIVQFVIGSSSKTRVYTTTSMVSLKRQQQEQQSLSSLHRSITNQDVILHHIRDLYNTCVITCFQSVFSEWTHPTDTTTSVFYDAAVTINNHKVHDHLARYHDIVFCAWNKPLWQTVWYMLYILYDTVCKTGT